MKRLGVHTRSLLRQLLWRVWPSSPSSWSQVPGHLRPAAVEIGRLTAAAVVSYLIALLVSPSTTDLTAPLTALLVVQASTVGTLRMGLVRVGAVLTGVLVAVGVSTFLGLSWWSLALVIAASLVLAKTLRLGEQSLETPISAMLILAVSSPETAAEIRVLNTLIGAVVGVGFSLLVPVAIPNTRAQDAVRGVARSQSALLDEVAITLGARAPAPDEVAAWFDWIEHIATDIDDAETAVRAAEDSRRWNAQGPGCGQGASGTDLGPGASATLPHRRARPADRDRQGHGCRSSTTTRPAPSCERRSPWSSTTWPTASAPSPTSSPPSSGEAMPSRSTRPSPAASTSCGRPERCSPS